MTLPAYNPVAITNANIITLINTDPLGAGLHTLALANPGNDAVLLTALNAVSSSYPVPAEPMSAASFEELFDAGEFATFTAAVQQQISLLVQAGVLNIGHAAIQADLSALFANYPKTLAAVQSKYTQPGTVWSYYFGVGQSASQGQLDSARNSGAGNNF